MSMHATFDTWEELTKYLQTVDHPKCFTVNYIPKDDNYALWLGNQPYYSYEELIELEQNEKKELRSELRRKMGRMDQLLDDILDDHDCSLSTRELIEEYYKK